MWREHFQGFGLFSFLSSLVFKSWQEKNSLKLFARERKIESRLYKILDATKAFLPVEDIFPEKTLHRKYLYTVFGERLTKLGELFTEFRVLTPNCLPNLN